MSEEYGPNDNPVFYEESLLEKIEDLKKKLDQQKFNNKHNLSIDQTIADKIQQLEKQVSHYKLMHEQDLKFCIKQSKEITIMKEALEKIEDPRKMDHQERDYQTQVYCLQNVAHVALEKVNGTYEL